MMVIVALSSNVSVSMLRRTSGWAVARAERRDPHEVHDLDDRVPGEPVHNRQRDGGRLLAACGGAPDAPEGERSEHCGTPVSPALPSKHEAGYEPCITIVTSTVTLPKTTRPASMPVEWSSQYMSLMSWNTSVGYCIPI
jgi:hypothetical protein